MKNLFAYNGYKYIIKVWLLLACATGITILLITNNIYVNFLDKYILFLTIIFSLIADLILYIMLQGLITVFSNIDQIWKYQNNTILKPSLYIAFLLWVIAGILDGLGYTLGYYVYCLGLITLLVSFSYLFYIAKKSFKYYSAQLFKLRSNIENLKQRNSVSAINRIEHSTKTQLSDLDPTWIPRGAFSIYGLTQRPWWETGNFEWIKLLEENYEVIKTELLKICDDKGGFAQYHYPGVGGSGWKTFHFHHGKKRIEKNCALCPKTTELIEQIPGYWIRHAVFSLLEPGAHAKPHRDGGSYSLNCHLGLLIPEKCNIRVGSEIRSWQEGKCILFDTSFEHEVWNHSNERRVVLQITTWHPELTQDEQQVLESTWL